MADSCKHWIAQLTEASLVNVCVHPDRSIEVLKSQNEWTYIAGAKALSLGFGMHVSVKL
jgi:hypothetical protein